jgi:putative ABC transport system substrate-binding protein
VNKRRKLLIAMGAGAFAAPFSCLAQQQGKVWRIGWLSPGSPVTHGSLLDSFRQGMSELGYVEGKNLVIEHRWAEGNVDRIPRLAAELVHAKPEVIVSGSLTAHRAVKATTSTIPIVMASGSDPVAAGLVASLARPGGNITGLTNYVGDAHPKLLELIHAALPKVARIAVLISPRNPMGKARRTELEHAAKALGITPEIFEVADADDITTAFSAMPQKGLAALLVTSNPMLLAQRERIVRLASRNRVAAIYPYSEFADIGGLMSYGASLPDNYRRAAYYVDRILKGTKPRDLPIEQPTKFELVINMKTAKALGLTIPQSVLVRADRVIE